MFKHCLYMEIVKSVSRWGNSAGVLLPREWLGNQVKVVLIERTLEIKKEILNILEPYLEDILGIYLVGSYARGEQEEKSDIDVIAISKNTKKNIKSGKYDISIVTLESVKGTLEKHPILILPRLNESKVILNPSLLEDLKEIRVKKSSFKEFIEDTKRIVKIDKGFLDLDKEQGFEYLDSISIIYSSILRLRGIFLARKLIENEKYKKGDFLKWLGKIIDKKELGKIYRVYEDIRDDKKVKEKVKIKTAEKLIDFLKKEVRKW